MKATSVTQYLSQTVEGMKIPMRQLAYKTGCRTVKPEHMLLVMKSLHHGFGGSILRDHLRENNITGSELKEKLLGEDKPPVVSNHHKVTLSKTVKEIFAEAGKLAKEAIGTGELLLALVKKVGNKGKIKELELNPEKIEKELKERNIRIPFWRRYV